MTSRSTSELDLPSPRPSAPGRVVIAHRHTWFADKVGAALADHDVHVVRAGGNGADAYAVVLAEHPDVLLVGEGLSVLASEELVRATLAANPQTRVVAQVGSCDGMAALLEAGATAAFMRQVPPEDVAAWVAEQLST